MPGDTSTLIYRFLGITGPAEASFDRMAMKTDELGAASAASHGKIAALVKGVALGGAVIGVASIKMAADYQRSMTMIQTQAGASRSEVESFSKSLLTLAPKVAQSPEALSTSLYHVYSALKKVGATAPQMLNTVKIAAEGAKVGNTDLEDTTNSLTATLASGIVKFNQAGKAMGMLNAIVGAGDMHFSDLNQALGTGLLVTMKTFGVSMRDTGAALAVFGDNNIRGADAATKLRMSVQDLTKPAANSDEVLAQVGLTADKLRQTLQNQGLNGALHLLRDRLDAAGITGKKVGGFLEDAFTKKAGAGLAILVTRLEQFDEAGKQVTKSGHNFGSAWQATTRTLSFAFDRLKVQAEAAMITLGTKLIPVVTDAANWLGKNLPHAISTLASILGPTAHLVGDVLGHAWTVVVDVLHVAIGALGSIGHFLSDNKSAVTAVTVSLLAMWAAAKTIALASAIFRGVATAVEVLRVKTALARMEMSGLSRGSVAMGAAMVGVGAVVYGLTQNMEENQRVAAQTKAGIEAYTQALNADSDAIGAHTRKQAYDNLEGSGAYAMALKLGISQKTLTDAALGNARALGVVGNATRLAGDDGVKLNIALGEQRVLLAGGKSALRDYHAAMDKGTTATMQSANAVEHHSGVLKTDAGATNTLTTSLAKLRDQYIKTTNTLLGLKMSQAQFLDSLHSMKQAIDASSGSLALQTVKGRAAYEALGSAAQGALQMYDGSTKSAKAVLSNVESLRQQAIQAGASKTQVDNLLRSLHLMPSQIRTKLHVYTHDAFNTLENFVKTPWTTYVQVVTTGNHAPSGGRALGQDTGASGRTGSGFGLNARFSGGLPNIDHRYGLDEIVTVIKKVKNYSVSAQNVARELAIGFLTGWKNGSAGLKDALSSPVQRALEHLTSIAQNAIAKQQAVLKKALANQRADLKSRASDIKSLAGNLGGDLSGMFGTDANGNPTTANVTHFLGGQRKTLEQFAKDLKWGARHGLSNALLSEIAGLGAVQGDEVLKQFMSGSASIANANKAEAAINRYSKQAASTVEDRLYAKRLAKDSKEVHEQTVELKGLRRDFQRLERHLAKQISTHVTIDAKTGKPKVDKDFIDEVIKGVKKAERLAGKKLV